MTIGSVVDYRVRDALLNIKLPRPKVIVQGGGNERVIEGKRKETVEEFTSGVPIIKSEKVPMNLEENSEENGSKTVKKEKCKERDTTGEYGENYKSTMEMLETKSPYIAANAEDLEDSYYEVA